MKISRFGPLLAVAGAAGLGAAGLVAWTLHSHAPPKPALSEADLARFARANAPARRAADLKSPSTVAAAPPSATAPSDGAAVSGKDAKVQLAYANLEGAAPELGASPAAAPPAETRGSGAARARSGSRAICACG